MARGVNKVILVGNLGADPELKYTASGSPVCKFRVATSEVFKDRDGNKQERTEWHQVTVWGKLAEACAQYLATGRQVYVEGSLRTSSWDDRDGNKRYATGVTAREVQFLGGDASGQTQHRPPPDNSPPPNNSGSGSGYNDDDIPF